MATRRSTTRCSKKAGGEARTGLEQLIREFSPQSLIRAFQNLQWCLILQRVHRLNLQPHALAVALWIEEFDELRELFQQSSINSRGLRFQHLKPAWGYSILSSQYGFYQTRFFQVRPRPSDSVLENRGLSARNPLTHLRIAHIELRCKKLPHIGGTMHLPI